MERNANTAERARQLYHERFKQILEKNSFGQFVAIEVDSEKYSTKLFHVIKIGYDAALLMKRGNFCKWTG